MMYFLPLFLLDDYFLAVSDVDAPQLRPAFEAAALQVVPAIGSRAYPLRDAVAQRHDGRRAVAVVDDGAGHGAGAAHRRSISLITSASRPDTSLSGW